jgi:hypothetical protein
MRTKRRTKTTCNRFTFILISFAVCLTKSQFAFVAKDGPLQRMGTVWAGITFAALATSFQTEAPSCGS